MREGRDFAAFLRRRWESAVAVKKAAPVAALAVLVCFWLGTEYAAVESRLQDEKIAQLREEGRLRAKLQLRRGEELSRLRAQTALDEKIISRLRQHLENSAAGHLRREQELALYRQLLSTSAEQEEIVIYTLTEDPGFLPGQRTLGATLARRGGKRFRGGYFFEVVHSVAGAQSVARVPEKKASLDFELYRKIEETFQLPPRAKIDNLRLVVVDGKNIVVAARQLVASGGEAAVRLPAATGR